MEVFVQDVPEQVTEKALRNLLQPYMQTLSIDTFSCQKPRQKRFAFLVFLDVKDGTRFLERYGATKTPGLLSNTPPKIEILRNPVFCNISNKAPNPHVLRGLEKEKNDKRTRSRTVHTTEAPRQASKKDFPLSSVSCGIWSYAGTDVVYVPCCTLRVSGQAKFGPRNLLVKLESGKRIEFPYSGMYGITSTPTLFSSLSSNFSFSVKSPL